MRFSVKYKPTTLFSLKDSSSTNSGAKSLLLPSPYAIKMAIINQAITIGNELAEMQNDNSYSFSIIRDTRIYYHIPENSFICVNNSFIKILKPSRNNPGFDATVAFREYVQLPEYLEIIIEVENQEAVNYLKQYLHCINYFGKRGCFFQFIEYIENPSQPNVAIFQATGNQYGILQQFDDFLTSATFEQINNYNQTKTSRRQQVMVLPLKSISSSKSYTAYKT